MTPRNILVVLSLALSLAIGFSLTRKQGERGSDAPGRASARPRLGLSLDTLKEERWQRDRDRFVQRATELDAELLGQSANSDDTRQVHDADILFSVGMDALDFVP